MEFTDADATAVVPDAANVVVVIVVLVGVA